MRGTVCVLRTKPSVFSNTEIRLPMGVNKLRRMKMLFTPIRIGTVELKNRIVMAPMATHFADENGGLTERQINYYSERAKGGAGLIVTESCCVRDDGKRKKYRLSISDDEFVPAFRTLTRAVHKYGAKIAAQLHHGGRLCTPQDIGEFPISASTIPCPLTSGDFFIGNIPRRLKIAEIKQLIECFGQGARRAYEAEFDLVQIHAGHGYLINNFLSPESNRREDRYGGNLDNRLRFLEEIIDCVRKYTHGKLPIMVRLNGAEFIPGGYGLEEAKLMARKLQEKGINEINITAGNHGAVEWSIQPAEFKHGCLTYLAQAIKRTIAIPVSTVGKITDPYFAEKILSEKKVDLIYFGRALIADPELPLKAREGKIKDIRKCIGCMNCVTRLGQGIDISCSINAQAGREKEYAISPTPLPKKILIIGGGPAGMETARVLSLRRHNVALYDRNNRLGGLLNIACLPPYRRGIGTFVNYLEKQLKNLKVDLKLNCEWKPNTQKMPDFDIIIFATGSRPIDRIEGIGASKIMTADECLVLGKIQNRRYIIVGGGAVGLQCADFLTETRKGMQVTVIEKESLVGRDIGNIEKKVLLNALLNKGVRILVDSQVMNIQGNEIVVCSGDQTKKILFDSLILAVGRTPNNELFDSMNDKHRSKYMVGDCVQPRKIVDAVHEAYKLALKI